MKSESVSFINDLKIFFNNAHHLECWS